MSDPQLFSEPETEPTPVSGMPLAAAMRPRTLEEFVGQTHLLGPGRLLRRLIDADRIQSVIFYGPPGTGKTSLSRLIARMTRRHFSSLSGVEASVSDIRKVMQAAVERKRIQGRGTILFLDEIHRLNKAQQDVLLPDIEEGTVALIGATTHNPSFFVNNALVSRSQVFQLEPLSLEEIVVVLKQTLSDRERGLGQIPIQATDDALKHWAAVSDGDARRALNALEIAARTTPPASDGVVHLDLQVAEESIQRKAVRYDADEDEHYDTISAFIKSVRGSDPDAAIYWLAKMIHVGEDPRFIARRLSILAAEDIGLADPMALVLANACFETVEMIGMPEGRIPLAETTLYLAAAPKSNSAILAIDAAMKDVQTGRMMEVPKALRDAHYKGAKKLGHGEGYKYAHDFEGHYVEQDYTPEKRSYYKPSDSGREKKIKEFLELLRKKP